MADETPGAPRRSTRSYSNDAIEVTFDSTLCIHAGECVRGVPEVFDTGKRPWIQPEHASAERIAEVIHRCPSGALTYRRLDGEPEEQPDAEVTIVATRNGPLYARGDLEFRDASGETIRRASRAALCRCGASANKPFCDNSHLKNGFEG